MKDKGANVALVNAPGSQYEMAPLSLAILQAALKNAGHKTSIFDLAYDFRLKYPLRCNILQKTSNPFPILRLKLNAVFDFFLMGPKRYYKERINEILRKKPHAICFSINNYNFLSSLFMARQTRKKEQSVKIIFGGPAFNYDFLKKKAVESDVADFVVDFEGDKILVEIIRNLSDETYQMEESILENLDSELLPDFSGIELIRFGEKIIPYSTTRGCFNNCTFCVERIMWRKYRAKSPKKIFKDISELSKRHSINNFYFSDSVSFGSKANIISFCKQVIESGLKINWFAKFSSNLIDEGMMELLKQSGCNCFSMGIESVSPRILKSVKKRNDIVHIEKVIRAASMNGIKFNSGFIVGFPGETWSDYLMMMRFIKRNRKYMGKISLNVLGLIKGTELYSSAEKSGIKFKNHFFWFKGWNNYLLRKAKLYILRLMI